MKLNFVRPLGYALLMFALFCSGCTSYRPIVVKQNTIRVLLVGGGASHDFTTWYK